MITKKDLQEFRKGLVTKDDLVKSQLTLVKEIKERFDDAIALVMKIMGDSFDKVNNRLDRVENRLDGVENRLDGVETELKDVKRQLIDLKVDTPTSHQFATHEKRITKLEEMVFQP